MSPVEIFTVLIAVLGAAALLRPADVLRWLYAPVALTLLAGMLWNQGLHWQMFPAYAVLLLCAILLSFRHREPSTAAARLGALVLILVAGSSLALCFVLPCFHLPAPTGPYAVGTRTEIWTDPATHRPLAVQFWYPAQPTGPLARYARLRETRAKFIYWHWIRTNSYQDAPVAEAPAPYPVLLFGHMWGGRRTQDTFLMEDLASHGYVVVSMDHPGNAARVELADGSVLKSDRAAALDSLERTGVAGIRRIWSAELKLWTADDEYVLDTLAAQRLPWLNGHLDLQRVGAFGHSFGGSSSFALLGLDPRVKSAVNFDGWTFEGLDRRTTQPVLVLYEAREEGMAGGVPTGPSVDDQLEREDRTLVDASLAAGGGTRAYVLGTQHADFTDATLYSPLSRLTYTGPIKPARIQDITRQMTLGFFNRTLKGQGQIPTFPEVRITPPGAP